jgi:hypothetical protein
MVLIAPGYYKELGRGGRVVGGRGGSGITTRLGGGNGTGLTAALNVGKTIKLIQLLILPGRVG